MTPKKVLDVLDGLTPETITPNKYMSAHSFQSGHWINNGDFMVMELCKIFPCQFPFLSALYNEAFDMMPLKMTQPGLVEELIYKNIISTLKTKTPKNRELERKIKAIWKSVVDRNSKPKRSKK